MKLSFVFACLLSSAMLHAQPATDQLKNAMSRMEKDDQFQNASVSLYVVDAKTGQVIFEKNAQQGLAPASTQKVITSVSAYELLGQEYRYTTGIGYTGTVSGNQLNGDIIIRGNGDPTLGSWRWAATSEKKIHAGILAALKEKTIRQVNGSLVADLRNWDTQSTPRGWTWEDMGNYYGTGAWALNWHENQYNLVLAPGKSIGDAAKIIKTVPSVQGLAQLTSEVKTAAAGTGDNAVIYLPEYGTVGFVRGTIPMGKETFTIKGSIPVPHKVMQKGIAEMLEANGITMTTKDAPASFSTGKAAVSSLLQLESPSLDSINYWFIRESINLYGEAFVKTIALKQKGFAATDSGLAIMRYFWSSRGISKSELNIIDGSGLSPANRTTTHALVTVMQYARDKKWYPAFYHALPLMNGIKMKSGYISGVRSYTGYIKSRSGQEYTFAFVVNNFSGSPASVREKMWKLLDILK